MDHERVSGISRRNVLTGLGAGVGIAALGAREAAAATGPIRLGAPAAVEIPGIQQATALRPALRYVLACGHDFAPLESPSSYSTFDGQFRFTGSSLGYASVLVNLPVGAVIRELELYGARTATGVVRLSLWRSVVETGDVSETAGVNVPAVAGPFTVTLAANDLQDVSTKSTPFVNIDAAAAPTAVIHGMRIGYESPTGFVALPTSVNPRVYDSRLPGRSKLAPNEERTITLPVPAAIGAAVMTLTLTNTEGNGGYVAAFAAGIPWPGNSSVNFFGPDQNIANTAVCAVSADSKITIRGGANRTDVIVDVAGWIA